MKSVLYAVSILFFVWLGGCGGGRRPAELPIGNVDTPKPGTSAKGSVRVSGWALSKDGIERVDAYLDGKFAVSSSISVSRPDVRSAYASPGDNDILGFDFQLDLSGKSAGPHELTVQARSRDGAVRELYRFPITVAP
jgi:hypothetical protein